MGWDSSVHRQAVFQNDAHGMSLIFFANKNMQMAEITALSVTLAESGMQSEQEPVCSLTSALRPHAWGRPLKKLNEICHLHKLCASTLQQLETL